MISYGELSMGLTVADTGLISDEAYPQTQVLNSSQGSERPLNPMVSRDCYKIA